MDRLRPTELLIARGVAEGKGDDEIARDLALCTGTIKKRLMNIYRLLDLPDDRNKRVLLAVTYCLTPHVGEAGHGINSGPISPVCPERKPGTGPPGR